MTSWTRALGFGFLVWLAPFAVAFLIFPLHSAERPLFESIMAVTVAGSAVVLAFLYLRRTGQLTPREGLALGILWLIVCILIDAPLMLFGGPMQMSLGAYMADIGVTYVMIPIITVGIAMASSITGASGPSRGAV